MHWHSTYYVVSLIAAATISMALALFAWQRRPAPGAMACAALMLAAAVWSLGYALEIGSGDRASKLLWAKSQYFGIATIPALWLTFALRYAGREGWLTPFLRVLLIIEPLVTLLLACTNEAHGLIWRSVRLPPEGSFPALKLTYGTWFWVHAAFSYLWLLLGTGAFIQTLRRSPSLYRGQAAALLAGAFVPWVGNFLRLAGLTPSLDLTPFAFTVWGLSVTWGLFRFRLLDVVPVARDAVIEGMDDGVIVLDAQHRIVDLNPAAQRLTSQPAAEVIGQPAAQVFTALSDPLERAHDATEVQAEILLDGGDTPRTYDLRVLPLRDRQGRLMGRLVVLQDINERKRAEEALRENEERERFRRFFEASFEGIAIHDKGHILDANQAFATLFGYELSEVIGRNALEFVAPESRDLVLRNVLSGYEEPYEAVGVRKDGSTFFAELCGKAILYQGRMVRVAAIRDITERKQAEEALRRMEELYRQAIAAANAVPYRKDYPTASYPFMGEGILQMTGYAAEEMTPELWGRITQETVMWGEAAGLTVEEAMRRALTGELRHWQSECRLVTRDGQTRWIADCSVEIFDETGQSTGSVGVLIDITERKRMERRSAAFAELGRKLNATTTTEEAARVIVETADELLGWDACFVDLYSPEQDKVYSVLRMDMVNGQRVKVVANYADAPPTPTSHRAIEEGGQLILRDSPYDPSADLTRFGDTSRPSLSLMFVPVRNGTRVTGVLSIQSYTPQAYDAEDLNTLQALADHCGGALDRLFAEQARRTSEAQLRESKKRLQYLVSATPVVIYSCQPSGDYAMNFISENVTALFGYEPRQFYEDSQFSAKRIHPEDAPRFWEEMPRLFERGHHVIEYRFLHQDGTYRWIHDEMKLVRDADGSPLEIVGYCVDVTERRQAEEGLRRQRDELVTRRALLETVLQLGKEVTQVTDLRSCLLKIYESVRDGLGFDRVGIWLYEPDSDLFRGIVGTSRTGALEEGVGTLRDFGAGAFRRLLSEPSSYVLTPDFETTFQQSPESPMARVKEHVAAALWAGEKPVGVLCVDNLLTQRPITEEQLDALRLFAGYAGAAIENARLLAQTRAAEEKYRSIFENAIEGVSRATPSGRFVIANSALAHMLGFTSPEELIESITDIGQQLYVEPPRRAEIMRLLEEQGAVRGCEIQCYRKDGSKIWVSLNARVVRDESGAGFYFDSTIEDITQRKQAEARQAALVEDMRSIVAIADELIACPNVDTVCRRAVELGREKLGLDRCSIFLLGGDEVHGTYGTDHTGRTTDERAYRVPREQWGVPYRPLELHAPRWGVSGGPHRTWDGQEFSSIGREGWIAWTLILQSALNPIGAFFNDTAITGAALDEAKQETVAVFCSSLGNIIQLKRAEETLRETNRRLEETLAELRRTQQQIVQQERLRALGTMASGIAHDFNNALAPIMGFSELLLMRPENLDDKEEVIEYLRTIHTAAQDAANVVSRLREFYRFRDEAEPRQMVSLNEVVEQTVLLTQPRWKDQALANGVTIHVETDLPPVPLLIGSEADLREALTNLIFNAVDAMPNGGTLTIKTYGSVGVWEYGGAKEATPTLPHPHTPTQVVLEVSDTGVGMDEETKRHCLEPFFSTKGGRGTGLGLAMAYGIVQRHEGTIKIESAVGKGTTVTIRMPVQVEQKTEDKKQPADSPSRPLHILLVEDNPMVSQVITEYLRYEGHTFETAANGREGLEKFRAGTFDLVVTDRAMPDMNGDRLAAAIKQVSLHTPIIMLTGFGEFMNAAGERPEGVSLIVSKPVTLNVLRQAIEKVTNVKRET